jgi:ion channel-forming bestrophin family protein
MYIKRGVSWRLIFFFAWKPVLKFIVLATLVYLAYDQLGWKFLAIPFLPIATIGTAVAFYVGFKNNSAYDRLWEGRRIWGSITNASRSFGAWITGWVGKGDKSDAMKALQREFIYRHLAWINIVKLQLRKTSVWDNHYYTDISRKYATQSPEEIFKQEVQRITDVFLQPIECGIIKEKGNKATWIMQVQSNRLAELKQQGLLTEFEHSDLEKLVAEFYNQQGAAERIKSFPFPRQYGFFSRAFVNLFLFLLPFGLLTEMAKTPHPWLMIPFSVIISWVFETMEEIGDSSENPFENSINDVPMNAICRNIEIDLREMLGETNLPEKIKPENGILM